MENAHRDRESDQSERKLPEANRQVIVYTDRFRCLGHLDFEGRWRDISRREIFDVIGWEPL